MADNRISAAFKSAAITFVAAFDWTDMVITAFESLCAQFRVGTYNPTVTPSTSGTITLDTANDTLQYTKVGRQVTVKGKLVIASVASPVGVVQIDLPTAYPAGAGTEGSGVSAVSVVVHNATAGFTGVPVGLIAASGTVIKIYEWAAGSLGITSGSRMQANTELYITATYDT